MKGTGEITRPMEEVGSFIPTVMSMKESGKMTRPMVKESITTMMAPVIMASGLRISNKALVFKNGLMHHPMKGNFCFYFKATS